MPLNRTQKRLLWVLDTYGDNEPYVAIYAYDLVRRELFGMPPLSIALRDVFSVYLESFSELTIGEAISSTLATMRRDVKMDGWPDTPCAKLIPHIARWLQRALDEGDARDKLDWSWNTEVVRVAALPIMPSPEFLGQAVELRDRFRYLCDWFLGARPDLGQYTTWQQADAAAFLWHDSLAIKDTMVAPPSTVVYEWPDGWTVAELDNWDAFRFEGGALGHCIGDHAIGYWDEYLARRSRFFSIRDQKNRPWLTIQVTAPYVHAIRDINGTVQQIKGCKNRLPGLSGRSRECPPPHPTECTRVFDFLNAAGEHWELGMDYQPCWSFTAAALGLPWVVLQRSPSGFPAGALVRPPSPVPVEPGHATKALEPKWW